MNINDMNINELNNDQKILIVIVIPSYSLFISLFWLTLFPSLTLTWLPSILLQLCTRRRPYRKLGKTSYQRICYLKRTCGKKNCTHVIYRV